MAVTVTSQLRVPVTVSIAYVYRDLGCVLLGLGGKAVAGAGWGCTTVGSGRLRGHISIGGGYFLVCASDG